MTSTLLLLCRSRKWLRWKCTLIVKLPMYVCAYVCMCVNFLLKVYLLLQFLSDRFYFWYVASIYSPLSSYYFFWRSAKIWRIYRTLNVVLFHILDWTPKMYLLLQCSTDCFYFWYAASIYSPLFRYYFFQRSAKIWRFYETLKIVHFQIVDEAPKMYLLLQFSTRRFYFWYKASIYSPLSSYYFFRRSAKFGGFTGLGMLRFF